MIRPLFLLVLSMLAVEPAAAQQNADIDAAARSVVRVVVVPQGEGGGGVGMGSGVAITPTRILTNAHVVESAVESDSFVGIVPSEGRRRYIGKVVKYAPEIDLAIVEISDGRIEPATLYGGSVPDGAPIAALGYPYGVDRAMTSSIEEVIRPQSPVKMLGHVSGRRTSVRYDTVVHDANIGRGNSGGPLVDACGRVVGINSFLSVSDGIDSPVAFALSVRELVGFLQKANVTPAVVTTPCLTGDETHARVAALDQADLDANARKAEVEARAADKAEVEKQGIRDAIAGERENGMAIAAAMLVIGTLAAVGGMILLGRPGRQRESWVALAVGGALALGAVVVFLGRPKLSEVEDRYAKLHPAKPAAVVDVANEDGPKLCVLNAARSRVTVSKTDNVSLDWKSDGCVNGKTQYGANAGTWSRTFVPNGEATVTIQSYDPAKTRYVVERFLLPADTMDTAREIRARYKNNACTADSAQRQSVAEMESAIRQALPTSPNERLVFDCRTAPSTDAVKE
ncbi:MAG: serine protease [Sphingomonadales bacterium]